MARKDDDYSWVDHAGRTDIVVHSVKRGRKVVTVLLRSPVANAICHIDTLRFVVPEDAISRAANADCVEADDYAVCMSRLLESITGFGLTDDIKPRDFYSRCWGIGPGGRCGHVGIGGERQNGTVLVSITGIGCLAFAPGWEQRLHQQLSVMGGRITRCDLARDDYHGLVTVHDAVAAWHAGDFDRYYNRPQLYRLGAWDGGDPYNKGLTANIGGRESSCEICAYEKGKQLGDADSLHTRIEVRYRDNSHHIPIDILVRPSDYYVAANAFCAQFAVADNEPARLERKAKHLERTFDHLVHHAKRCYGPFIRLGRALYGDSDILNLLQADSEDWPVSLDIGDYDHPPVALHHQARPVPLAVVDAMSYDDRKSHYAAQYADKMPRRVRTAIAAIDPDCSDFASAYSQFADDFDSSAAETEFWLARSPRSGLDGSASTASVYMGTDASRHGRAVARELAVKDRLGVLPSGRNPVYDAYCDGNSLSPVSRF